MKRIITEVDNQVPQEIKERIVKNLTEVQEEDVEYSYEDDEEDSDMQP